MVQLSYNTVEEVTILVWTAFLTWMPNCKLFPFVCDFMTNGKAISVLGAFSLILVALTYLLPHTRYGQITVPLPPAPSTSLCDQICSISRQFKTPMQALRTSLCLTLPLFGVMLSMHPTSVGMLCLLKKLLVLESNLWKKWCPESYIILFSFCSILCLLRRSLFTRKMSRFRRTRESHLRFKRFSPAYVLE